MMFAVGPPGNQIAAKMKVRTPRITTRPATSPWGEREDFFGDGELWVGEGGRPQRGLCGRRRGRGRSGRPRVGTAVGPNGDRSGSFFDLGNRHRPRGQQAKHDTDPTGDAAITMLPTSDAPWTDAE